MAEEYGIKTIINPMLNDDISESIRLGMLGIDQTSDACLFRVCDQPFLEKDSIQKVIKHFHKTPCNIISLSFGLKRGNPVLFPKKYFAELANLLPGENGKTIIKRHIDDLVLVNSKSHKEIIDIDTVADYYKFL
jgi:CTP:molybdopterin cytidylyltransferase MocA